MSKIKKRLFIICLLAAATMTLMIYQQKHGSIKWLSFVSYPYDLLSGFSSRITGAVSEFWNTYDSNKVLKKQNAELLLERQKYTEIILENTRLKALLELKQSQKGFVTAASVTGRGYDRFLNTLIIDKGAKNGIQKNMAVVTTKGLVGKIQSLSNDTAEILLINDPNFSVAVRLQQTRHEGVLSGTGRGFCELKYIPPEETVQQGDIVITSGLDGLFPEGIPVGVVQSIRRAGIDFFLDIRVATFSAPHKTEEVVVVRQRN
ncbi:MAG: rod shape-determining protein MreC [Nitrospiraceae bacterium]|nr:rod shape-determining protein MreC [Nitrospiraceae bacterium]